MKRFVARASCFALLGLLATGLSTAATAEDLPRNPFWPQGYDGKRYPISAEPRYHLSHRRGVSTNSLALANSAATSAAGLFDESSNDAIWSEALATLRFGATLAFSDSDRTQAAIEINDRVYAVGDLVSTNFKGHRLTWRVESFSSEGKVALKRLTYRKIGP